MNSRRRIDRTKDAPPRARPGEQMGEQRYQELMRSLNHLFQEADQDFRSHSDVERQQVIEEIITVMERHGITIEDINK